MDSRIIYYPPKTYFKNVKVPRAATKLWYVDTKLQSISGSSPVQIQNFLGIVTRLATNMDEFTVAQNH